MPTLADHPLDIPAARVGVNGHATRPMTPDELVEALCREEGEAEIVGGKIVQLDMTEREPGFAGDEIFFALRPHVKAAKLATIAVGDGKAFLCDLPRRQSFAPDAAYYEGTDSGMKFFPSAPRFAAEVRSENDYGVAAKRDMTAKRGDYFAAGNEVVWDVDLLASDAVVRKFTRAGGARTPIAVYERSETADAEPAVPGFTMPVDELFG